MLILGKKLSQKILSLVRDDSTERIWPGQQSVCVLDRICDGICHWLRVAFNSAPIIHFGILKLIKKHTKRYNLTDTKSVLTLNYTWSLLQLSRDVLRFSLVILGMISILAPSFWK